MKLHQALLSNAIFSGISAVFIFLGHERLALEIPLSSLYWMIIAAGLGLFSGQLLLMAMALINQQFSPKAPKAKLVVKLTPSVIVNDVIWLVGSFTLAGIFANQISTLGLVIIMAVNICVGSLVAVQVKGLKAYRAG